MNKIPLPPRVYPLNWREFATRASEEKYPIDGCPDASEPSNQYKGNKNGIGASNGPISQQR